MQWMPFNFTWPKVGGAGPARTFCTHEIVVRFAFIHLIQSVKLNETCRGLCKAFKVLATENENPFRSSLKARQIHWHIAQIFALVFGICICNSHSMIRRKLLHFTFRSLLTFANICCVFIGVLSSFVSADCVRPATTFCAHIKIQLLFLASKSEI